jgi:hypothetical protein
MSGDKPLREAEAVATALRRLAAAEALDGGLPDPERIWRRARILHEVERERAMAWRAALPALAGQLAACAVLATALLHWLVGHAASIKALFAGLAPR